MTNQTMKIIGYYRVSTKKQGASGLGKEAQQESVRAWAKAGQHEILEEYTETESGSMNDRPKLKAAMQHAMKVGATLVIAKLDRLSRNVAFLMDVNDKVTEGKLKVQALDVPQFNTLTIGIIATMAQYERELASARTKAALQAKKARGEKVGQKLNKKHRAMSVIARRHNSQHNPANVRAWGVVQQLWKGEENHNYRATAMQLNKWGILTAKGGEWQGIQIQRLEKMMTTGMLQGATAPAFAN